MPDDPQLWNWGALPRDDAVRKLTGHPDGTFLVRASASAADAYSISVVRDGQVQHVRINSVPGGFAMHKGDMSCKTLAVLVAKNCGKRMTASLHGKSAESRLLISALPNPKRLEAFQAATVSQCALTPLLLPTCTTLVFDTAEPLPLRDVACTHASE